MSRKLRLQWALAVGGAVSALSALPAWAETRAAGQSFVYELTESTVSKTDLSSLPASIRAQAEKNMAAANGKKITTKLTLAADRVDADGNAHFNATYTQSMEGLSGITATAFAAAQEFQGTLSADGRVLPAHDPAMPATLDAHGRYSAAEMQNIHAQQMQGRFGDFNIFAMGLTKHPHPKAGDVWRLVVQDAYGVSRPYEFSVSAPGAQDGLAAPAVSMKADLAGPASSSQLAATGHYDGVRRLVTDFHAQTTYSSTTPTGISSSGVSMLDIRLRE
jgi:hypothetical protein